MISFVCSTIVFGVVSYHLFYENEGRLIESQEKSIGDQFKLLIRREVQDVTNSLLILSAYLESEFPNASSWPNVAVPFETYGSLHQALIQLGHWTNPLGAIW